MSETPSTCYRPGSHVVYFGIDLCGKELVLPAGLGLRISVKPHHVLLWVSFASGGVEHRDYLENVSGAVKQD